MSTVEATGGKPQLTKAGQALEMQISGPFGEGYVLHLSACVDAEGHWGVGLDCCYKRAADSVVLLSPPTYFASIAVVHALLGGKPATAKELGMRVAGNVRAAYGFGPQPGELWEEVSTREGEWDRWVAPDGSGMHISVSDSGSVLAHLAGRENFLEVLERYLRLPPADQRFSFGKVKILP